MATALSEKLTKEDDEKLGVLVKLHEIKWTHASNDGVLLMTSIIGNARDGSKFLNDIQTSKMASSFAAMVEAGNVAIQIRSRCMEIGYSRQT